MDDIVTRLGLDTSPFARALRGVTGQLKAFGANIAGAVGGTVEGFLGGAALVVGAKRLVDYASSLGDMAEALGITTKFLQEFNYATTQNGVEEEKATKALSKLSVLLGKAADGADDALKVFSDLGVKITNQNGTLKTTEQVLKEIATAFSKSGDGAKNASIAVELFGKEGVKLIPTLKGGAAGLEAMAKAGHASIISDENITNLKEVGDTIKSWGKTTMGVVGNLVGGLISGWQQLARWTGAATASRNVDQVVNVLRQMNALVDAAEPKIIPKQSQKDKETVDKLRDAYKKLMDQIKENDAGELQGPQKLKALNDIFNAKQKEWFLEKDKVKAAEKLLELEKARNDVVKEGAAQAKERRKLEDEIKKANQDLRTAKEDRSKFNLQDLAASPIRFAGRLEQERIGARQVVQLTNRADFLTKLGYGAQANELRNRADFIRSQLTNVVEAERFPFKTLEENSKSAAASLALLSSSVEGAQVNKNGAASGGVLKTKLANG